MKKILFVAVMAMTGHGLSAQNKLVGIWQGKVNAAVELRVVFTIKQDPSQKLTAIMDLPDQGINGIVANSLVINNDSIHISIKEFNGVYSGKQLNDSTINGIWKQGIGMPLQLKKVEKVHAIHRAQTPVAPFPYKTEDVIYFNKEKTIQYGATITIPQGNGPFPAVILITGSGQQNRDEEIAGHKPFAVIADHLTRKGFIVLRVDDRGIGQTTGDMKVTSLEFSGDVSVSINYLKSRKETDKRRIALIGHSEGGMIAQMQAAQSKDIAAIVLMAAPGVSGADVLIEQNREFFTVAGLPKDYVAKYTELYNLLMEDAKRQPNPDSIRAQVTRHLEDWIQATPANIVVATTGIMNEKRKADFIEQFSASFSNLWIQYFIHYNPKEYLEKISCPVLALNGSKDIQVISKSNLPSIEAALKNSKSKDYQLKEYEGLNHLFQKCKTCTTQEYAALDETISVEVLEDIAAWLRSKLRP